MSNLTSFPGLCARLQSGDEAAALRVVDRFTRRLVGLARSRLRGPLRQHIEPEDIVQSVFRSFFRRCRGGLDLAGWDGLWALLALITVRKCVNRAEYLQAACRDVRKQVPLGAADEHAWELPNRAPTPLEAAVLIETIEGLMHDLDDSEQHMLSLALQGHGVPEISPRVGRSERTVRRLLDRIRGRLERLQHEDS